jgi:hypothetical protein
MERRDAPLAAPRALQAGGRGFDPVTAHSQKRWIAAGTGPPFSFPFSPSWELSLAHRRSDRCFLLRDRRACAWRRWWRVVGHARP